MTDRTRTYSWADVGPVTAELLARPGLEFLRDAIERGLRSPMMSTLGIRLTAAGEGTVELRCTPDEFHGNQVGIVHGGLAATLLDTALSGAVHTLLSPGDLYSTVEMSVHYTRPVTAASGELVCEGRVVNAGRRLVLAEGHVRDAAGKLAAHGTATLLVTRAAG